jgi:hypothetical protein
MAIEDCKESLTANVVKIDDKGVGVLHCAPGALFSREPDAKCGVVCGMTIEDLGQE